MATVEPQLSTLDPETRAGLVSADALVAAPVIEGPRGWKRRLEDPLNIYYRYPVALAIVRRLMPTSITPNQVSLVQPVIAAAAGWMVTVDDWRYHLGAVALFELRSILDCVDGSLARAKKLSSPNGHAIDAMADWLGVVFLYAGILHYLYHHPAPGVSSTLSVVVVLVALAQGGLRSFASDYYKNKYLGIFERSRDEAAELLRDKHAAIGPESGLFARIELFILWAGRLIFEGERYCPTRTQPLDPGVIARMVSEQDSPRARRIGALWSVSSGDAFLSFVVLTILVQQIWLGQIFFATLGSLWILAVVAHNVAFLRSYRRG